MKVLLFSNMYPTKDKPQFGIYVYNQVKHLEKKGHEFKIVSLKSKGNKYLRYIGFFMRGLYHSTIKGKSYDLVHAHYTFPPGIFAMIHKKRYKSKMVITSHGSDINKMPDMSVIFDKLIKIILTYSDTIVCVSENMKNKVVQRYEIEESKIKVINMGVDTELFKKVNKNLTRSKYNLPADGDILLFVGNFYFDKGVLDIIKAFKRAQIPNKLLILIGDRNVELQTQKEIANINKENILILDPQPQATIVEYMNAADVFVLPSYSEGFNLVTLEAMATETVVVTSDIEAFDYLADDTVIKCKVGDIESLTKSIEKAMCLQKHEFTQYISNGMKIASENSAINKANQISTIYHNLQ